MEADARVVAPLSTVVHVGVAVAVAGLAAIGVITDSPFRALLAAGEVRMEAFVGLAAAVAAVLSARLVGARRADVLVAVVLGLTYVSLHNRDGMGDGGIWKLLSLDDTGHLWTSSYLSHLLLRGLYRVFDNLPYYAPVLGTLTALGVFRCLRAVLPDARVGTYVVSRLAYLGVGFHCIFLADFLETTMPSVVVALLGVPSLVRYVTEDDNRRAVRRLVEATAALVLAACFHGQFVMLLPAVGVVGLVRLQRRRLRRTVVEAAAAAVTAVALVGAVWFLTVVVLGFEAVKGDSAGGGDGKRFAPDLLGKAHLQTAGSVVAWFVGAAVAAGVVACIALALRRAGFLRRPPALVAGLLAAGWLAFAFLWGFDLGYPHEADLMMSMGALAVPAFALWSEAATRVIPRLAVVGASLLGVAAQAFILGGLAK